MKHGWLCLNVVTMSNSMLLHVIILFNVRDQDASSTAITDEDRLPDLEGAVVPPVHVSVPTRRVLSSLDELLLVASDRSSGDVNEHR